MPELAKRVTDVRNQVVHVLALDVSQRKTFDGRCWDCVGTP
jgi:hypothetical protein